MGAFASSFRVRAAWLLVLVVACKRESSPPPDCEVGPTTRGIDVSYYQDVIDWTKVRDAGVAFAFIRVSDSTLVDDPMFERNWAAAKKAGVLRGAYQFFRPDDDVRAQADLLVDAIARDPGELPPVIDVEVDGGKRPDEIAKRVRAWLARVHKRLGVEPIVYTGPAFWRDSVGGADVGHSLWIAHYTEQCPMVPAPWTTWTYWQYSEFGSVPGIRGRVDLDVFRGTLDELQSSGRVAMMPANNGRLVEIRAASRR
ncbi:MAG TPA: GH25 family lysozyme [Kofleriaceae bacterium]|jgi:lysozyme|nr:GH25 family lysozyme [Kofleriaceae bacterium]